VAEIASVSGQSKVRPKTTAPTSENQVLGRRRQATADDPAVTVGQSSVPADATHRTMIPTSASMLRRIYDYLSFRFVEVKDWHTAKALERISRKDGWSWRLPAAGPI
jgi:hypothetical protein